jgi:nanoRNase/pAp phosphatase (c-di-AMP/oligoRNAs hydrolase)
MQQKIIKEIINKLMSYNTVVLTAHKNPDGDAISSSYGLALALLKAFPQKKILVIGDPDELERRFTFLKFRRELFIKPTETLSGHYVAIIGDTSVSSRIEGYEIVKNANTRICFDHHNSKADITYDIF